MIETTNPIEEMQNGYGKKIRRILSTFVLVGFFCNLVQPTVARVDTSVWLGQVFSDFEGRTDFFM
jgi:hypothetical protein